MNFIIPNRILVAGDTDKARNFIGVAQSQMNILLNQMSFQKLNQGVRRLWLNEDIHLECIKVFNIQECRIWARPTPANIIIELPSIPIEGLFLAYGYYSDDTARFQHDLIEEQEDGDAKYAFEWIDHADCQREFFITYDYITVMILNYYRGTFYARILFKGKALKFGEKDDMLLAYYSDDKTYGLDISQVTEDIDGEEVIFYKIVFCGILGYRDQSLYTVREFKILEGEKSASLENISETKYTVPEGIKEEDTIGERNAYLLLGCKIDEEGITRVVYHRRKVTYKRYSDSYCKDYEWFEFLSTYTPSTETWADKEIARKIKDPADYILWGAPLLYKPPTFSAESIDVETRASMILWNPLKREASYVLRHQKSTNYEYNILSDLQIYSDFYSMEGTGQFGPWGFGSADCDWCNGASSPFRGKCVNEALVNATAVISMPDYLLTNESGVENSYQGGEIIFSDEEFGDYFIDDSSIRFFSEITREIDVMSSKEYSIENKAVASPDALGISININSREYEVYEISDSDISFGAAHLVFPYEEVTGKEYSLDEKVGGIEDSSYSNIFPYLKYVKAVLLHTVKDVFPKAIIYARGEYDEEGNISHDAIKGLEIYMVDEDGNKMEVGKDTEMKDETLNSQWNRAFFIQV